MRKKDSKAFGAFNDLSVDAVRESLNIRIEILDIRAENVVRLKHGYQCIIHPSAVPYIVFRNDELNVWKVFFDISNVSIVPSCKFVVVDKQFFEFCEHG